MGINIFGGDSHSPFKAFTDFATQRTLGKFNPQDLANIVWAYFEVENPIASLFNQVAVAIVAQDMKSFLPRYLSKGEAICYRSEIRDGGTSHIAPPNMNSYIKKYEFISTVTCEFLHMNSYVSDPCLVYKKMATDGGGEGVGGVTTTILNAILVPGSNPQNLDTFFV